MKRIFCPFAARAAKAFRPEASNVARTLMFCLGMFVLYLFAPSVDAHAACWAAWSSTTAYNGGAQVSYGGENYQAAYWTQGNNPSTSSGPAGSGQPWIPEGSCSGGGGATPTPTRSATPTPTQSSGGCAPTTITPYIKAGTGAWQQTASVTISASSSITFGPQPTTGGSWSWSGPGGYTSTARQITVTVGSTSTYTATYTNAAGCKSTLAFTVTVKAGGATPTPTATVKPTVTATPTKGGGSLPAHVLMGYWQDFTNGAKVLSIADVPTSYNIIAVAFGTATTTPGQVAFSIDSGLSSALGGYSTSQFISDINTAHSRGQKVILSVGGQDGAISVSDSASASNFANSVSALMNQYGFDGVDIDLESGINPTEMAAAISQLKSKQPNALVTAAPQTVDTMTSGDDYYQFAAKIGSNMTMMNTQYYNSGSMNGCDGNVYSEGTENFITALACTELQGLPANSIGVGLPASASAAGSGYVSPSVVVAAIQCLAGGTNCGSFKPPAKWPGLRGVMTWSINWDASNGYGFANGVRSALNSLP